MKSRQTFFHTFESLKCSINYRICREYANAGTIEEIRLYLKFFDHKMQSTRVLYVFVTWLQQIFSVWKHHLNLSIDIPFTFSLYLNYLSHFCWNLLFASVTLYTESFCDISKVFPWPRHLLHLNLDSQKACYQGWWWTRAFRQGRGLFDLCLHRNACYSVQFQFYEPLFGRVQCRIPTPL